MIIDDISKFKRSEKIKCSCDSCKNEFLRLLNNVLQSRRKRKSSEDFCRECSYISGAQSRPQNSKEYWKNEDIIKKHSLSIKSSKVYHDGILNRNTSGIKNSMFGKKHTIKTKKLMSISRTGKIRKETHKQSLNQRIKAYIHRVTNWYFKVYQRDGFKCTKCGDNKSRLDAHHIIPISILIKQKSQSMIDLSDNEKYTILIEDRDIIDKDLKNGITLCRSCHKKEHKQWGSHHAEV